MFVIVRMGNTYNVSNYKDISNQICVQVDNYPYGNSNSETFTLKFENDEKLLQFANQLVSIVGKGGENV